MHKYKYKRSDVFTTVVCDCGSLSSEIQEDVNRQVLTGILCSKH